MLRERNWFLATLILVYLVALELLSWWTSKFPPCAIPSQYQRASYQSEQQSCATFFEGVCNLFWFFWSNATHTNVVAASSALVAIFTWTLWRSTNKLWLAGLRQAEISANSVRALVMAEQPYVFLQITDNGIDVSSDGSIRFATRQLQFQLANFGKTPAFLHELKVEFPIIEDMREIPSPMDPQTEHPEILPMGCVSTSGAPFARSVSLLTLAIPMLDDGAWRERRLFIQGFVRYSDTFNHRHITGFLSVFDPMTQRWQAIGGVEHNYNRRE
jgi:hypothetical protein